MFKLAFNMTLKLSELRVRAKTSGVAIFLIYQYKCIMSFDRYFKNESKHCTNYISESRTLTEMEAEP